jgi:hypothetical protein
MRNVGNMRYGVEHALMRQPTGDPRPRTGWRRLGVASLGLVAVFCLAAAQTPGLHRHTGSDDSQGCAVCLLGQHTPGVIPSVAPAVLAPYQPPHVALRVASDTDLCAGSLSQYSPRGPPLHPLQHN